MTIKKCVIGGLVLEVGDFYGSGEDEVVVSFLEQEGDIQINTSAGFYSHSLKPGDYILYEDGSAKITKSKHDIQDE